MKFIIDVKEGETRCDVCPWINNRNVCEYCEENELCNKLDFSTLHLKEYEEPTC